MITGYESTRESGNVIHSIIGRPSPEVTLRAAGLRTGNLEALLLLEADAIALESLLAKPKTLLLTDPDVTGVNMSFVLAGPITRTLEDDTRRAWLVKFDFQEVAPV